MIIAGFSSKNTTKSLSELLMISNTQKVKDKTVKSYKTAAGIITAVIIAVAAIIFFFFFDKESRYLTSHASLTSLLVLLGAGAGFALSGVVFLNDTTLSETDGTYASICSFISAVGIALFFIYYIYSCFTANNSASSGIDRLTLALIISSVFAFAYSVTKTVHAGKTLTLLFGYLRILFFALIITKLYLDFSVELNAPVKLIIQFAAAALMLSTVADLRIAVGRTGAPAFMSSKLFAMTLSSLNLVLLVAEIFPHAEKYGADYIAFSILIAICGIETVFQFFASKIAPNIEEAADETVNEAVEETVDQIAEEAIEETVEETVEETPDTTASPEE